MFNWFRRQFNDPGKPEQEQDQPETTQEAESESETETAEPTAEQVQQENYLKWAKTAYQSIQQRQTETTEATPTEDAETEEETAVAESDVEPVAEVEPQIAEVEPEPESEPVAEVEPQIAEVEPEPESEPVAEVELEPESEPVAEVELEPDTEPDVEAVAEAEPEVEVSQPPAAEETEAPTPAWMRKSDAFERLKATAIETPESEAKSTETTKPAKRPGFPGLSFDEEFLWSARVLAEQGRNPEEVDLEEISWLKRLRQGLGKTRRGLVNQLKAVVGQGPLNADAVMEIEALLLQADVGVEATDYIIETLQEKLREEALPPEEAIAYLKKILCDLLDAPLENPDNPLLVPEKDILNIWLLTGVNGAGKTTTLGKLARLAQKSGYRCLIAAADTFRAAAVEQVKVWGERSGTPVIANQGKNTDPAAVVYDAIAAARSRNTELLLIDTAGRLQNKKNLMAELAKIRRIIDKQAPEAKVESLLVLDATLGQNGLRQAEVFSEAAKLSGAVLTKLDGTAKGGVALAVARQLDLPIRFIGAGEGIEDLRPFSSYEFIEALLSE
ncbi:MAG: signal recognition particle-docking protein FtsY [Cyanobacteriota bacterium]|nr:signal recognition particle-docking protein FtsY [Cyanobacteriota bacterium]